MYKDSNYLEKKTLGNKGEDAVAQKLAAEKFTLLTRNFRKKGGEIDIIAQQNDLIIFVEVKTRTTDYFALSEIINPSKQRRIIHTARSYIVEKKMQNVILRFDVALVQKNNAAFEITYIENAFQPTEE